MPHKFLPLSVVLRYLPMMEAEGVSTVARSPRGFVTAYEQARGNPRDLDAGWVRGREAFLARHVAQLVQRDEPLYDEDGQPTRRHLALIAWAYSPDPRLPRPNLK